MKKRIRLMVLATFVVLGMYGQESPQLMTIGNEQVSLAEFERIYLKNNNETSLNQQTPEEYLELFINFKLKVKEAESLGMDTTAKFINELEGYRKQLAKPYLVDEEAKEEMMREAWEWSKEDINASHILIRLPASPLPEDTAMAYEKIMQIRERILGGESFENVARATSDDASAKQNGGNLNYFTVFSMVYPFEAMAYNTPVGELSMPFRSAYGYHILKVNDRRPARGQVKVAHIFFRAPGAMSDDQKKAAYQKVQVVYDSLLAGADFAALARNNSEDPGSSRNGGEIPWFGTGRMIPEFEDACFSIENKGEYSRPFKSSYGWHIVKLVDKKGIGSYEEMKPELQQKINSGGRSAARTDRYVSKLKTEYGFSEYPSEMAAIYAAADSTLLTGNWQAGQLKNSGAKLFSIGTLDISIGEFALYLESNQNKGKANNPIAYADMLYQSYVNERIMQYEEERLSEKYPEFAWVYEEYHDGILLFDIMDQKVWSKAVADSSGLEAFHKAHKKDYMWEKRTEACLVKCSGDVDLQGIRDNYKKIVKKKLDEASLNARYCSNDTIPCISITPLLLEKGENEELDALNGVTGPGPITEEDGISKFIIVKGTRQPEPKKLDEARGQITSDYQEYLEAEWIKYLKEKFPVSVDRSLLTKIKS